MAPELLRDEEPDAARSALASAT